MITHAHTWYIKQSSAIVFAIPYWSKEKWSLLTSFYVQYNIKLAYDYPHTQPSKYVIHTKELICNCPIYIYCVLCLQNHEFTLDEVISCLTELEMLCTDRKEYDNLCFLLTLPSITADKAYKNWNPSSARISCFNQVHGVLYHRIFDVSYLHTWIFNTLTQKGIWNEF